MPHRRSLLIGSVLLALVSSAPCQNASSNNAEPVSAPKAAPVSIAADGFTLAAVGDLIVASPPSTLQDEGFKGVLKVLRDSDVAFGNLEETLIDLPHFQGYPQAEHGGVHLYGPPSVATDLRAMGFRMFARANNHTTDWGVEGMRETDKNLDAAGLVHAGTGENRAAARAPRYLQTAKGRIALVALTSTPTPMSIAGKPQGESPGRPGVSALRLKTYSIVTPEMMQGLRKIAAAQPKGSLLSVTGAQQEKPNELDLFGVHYREGEQAGHFTFEMDDIDLRETLKSIRQGRENSEFVIATIHAHEPGNWSDEPADFVPKLAHAAIDTGADAFITHGPHRLRGIEIYNGKPIFYSLGNFFFQIQALEPVGADIYEAYKGDPATLTDSEYLSKLAKVYFNGEVWYQSVIAVSRFDHGQVSEVRLYPVDLSYAGTLPGHGVPRIAPQSEAQAILRELQRLSKPFGTVIEIDGSIGIIRLRK